MKKSILFSVLVVGATLLQAQSITVHQTCGQNGQVVKAISPEAAQAVDLGLSVKWANMNVGAESPEGYGDYFAWGETSTKETYSSWDTYFDTNDGGSTFTKYNNEGGKTVLDPEDDAAHVNWGGSWRMPTEAECKELLDNCTWTWTTQNGTNGYKVTSNRAGYTDKFIFLPAAGLRDKGGFRSFGGYGSFWSLSLTRYSSLAVYLLFNSDSHRCDGYGRYVGRSVRPVLQQTSISYSSSTNDTIRIYSNGCDDYQTFIGSHGSQLTMTANSDQWSHFVRWQDGNTDNPRTITTNGNADYTAYFETPNFSVQVQSNDAAKGSGYISKVVKTETIEYNESVGSFEAGSEVYLTCQANYGYHFAKWSDGNTDNPRTLQLTQDTTLVAMFESEMDINHPTNPGTYQLTLNMSIDDAGVVTGAGMYAQGTEVSVSATANTGYTFERWSDGVTDASRTIAMIARDSTLTAIFSINRYTITFVDEDGTTVLSSDEYDYGATPVAPTDPTKAATAQYTYTFTGWSPAIATVTEAATYTATYSQTVNKYTITFLDEDGTTVLSSDEYDYGATPVAPEAPTKAATEDNYFVFNGWDKPLATVTAAATYTATYNSFLNYVTISGNQDLAELAVGEHTHVTIGANDTLTISSPVTIGTLTFSTNGNNASQINGIENLTLTNAEMIIRLEPVANTATANKWYAFGVPFEVEVTGGIYAQGSESPAVYNSAFILDEYDGALRASSQDGWKRVASSATLRPGVLYMIAISGTINEWRMVKRAEAAFTESASLSVNAYPSAIGAHHAGWNGLANTLLHSATASLTDVEYITTYNNAFSVYEVSPIAEVSLATAQPFFVQTPQAGTINFAKQRANSPARYLQQAASQTASYTLSLSSDTYTDHAYLTTATDKEDVYCIGRDLVKMQPTTPSVPQLWIVRYDTYLAAYEIPFANDEATVTLGLYAPQAGEYRFGLENISDEYVFTLLYQGIPVTELDDQPSTLSLEQGEHTYSLRIAKKPEYITALPDEVQGDDVQYTKFLRNGQVFILRGDKIYTLTGQEVK